MQAEKIRRFLRPKENPPHMPLNRTDDEEGLNLPSPITRKPFRSPIRLSVPTKATFRTLGIRRGHLGGG